MCWCEVCELCATFCVLQALCNIKPKLVRHPEGEWETLIHAYLFLPQDTPLEFSHQFYNLFWPEVWKLLKRSLESISDFGRIPFMSLKILSKFRSHREYLVHTQDGSCREMLLECSTHGPNYALHSPFQGHNDSFWEWAGCAGSCGFLGSSWAFFRWQRWELQATSSDWVKAWSHFYARNDGIYYTGNHRESSLATCLLLLAWSLQTCPMVLPRSPKCQQQVGVRFWPTWPSAKFPRTSLLELLLQLVTLDGSSSHLLIRRSRKQSSMQSWQTEDWRWWPSLACSFRWWRVKGEWWWVMFKGWRVKGDGWWVNGETSSDIGPWVIWKTDLLLVFDKGWSFDWCLAKHFLYLFLILWGMINAC